MSDIGDSKTPTYRLALEGSSQKAGFSAVVLRATGGTSSPKLMIGRENPLRLRSLWSGIALKRVFYEHNILMDKKEASVLLTRAKILGRYSAVIKQNVRFIQLWRDVDSSFTKW